MKTLSSGLSTAIAQKITQPGYLVRIGFSVPQFISTRDTLSWGGNVWTAYDVRVDGFAQDGKGQSSAKITLANHDLYWSAFILNEGIADRSIQIWAFDGAATGTGDFEPVFSGVGNTCDIQDRSVVINCLSEASRTSQSPRRYIGPSTGFNHLSPDQKKVTMGGTTIILDRRN